MLIIAGLGNPTKEYEGTRHNAGFAAVDRIADKYGIRVGTAQCRALTGKGIIAGKKVMLVKPQTYMNNSGESLRGLIDYYHLNPQEELLVIYDDVSLEPGQIRVRTKGSAGGHNGIKSIISHLGTQEFTRIRIGVGEKPKGYDLADYVLGHFAAGEKELMNESFAAACDAAEMIVSGDTAGAMNRYNRKKKAEPKGEGKAAPKPEQQE